MSLLGLGMAALHEAARVDRTFDPRWTLANYYFRRQNWDEFWKWMRAAAEMSYGDRSSKAQMKQANNAGATFAILIGESKVGDSFAGSGDVEGVGGRGGL